MYIYSGALHIFTFLLFMGLFLDINDILIQMVKGVFFFFLLQEGELTEGFLIAFILYYYY